MHPRRMLHSLTFSTLFSVRDVRAVTHAMGFSRPIVSNAFYYGTAAARPRCGKRTTKVMLRR